MQSELTKQILSLQQGDHLCLFYENDPAEQMPALVPFIAEGLSRNEQCIYIADDHTVDELSTRLAQSGIDVREETARGRLKLWTRKEWRQPGELVSDRKAAQVREFIQAAAAQGFKGVRFAVEMTWTLGPDISAEQLEHWEATINTIFVPGFPGRIICQYNRSRMAPEVLMAGLHTHPLAIVGDQVCPNPFYQAPLILKGNGHRHANGDGAANGHGRANGQARAKVDWMISQLQQARLAEKQREELVQARVASVERKKSEVALQEINERMQAVLDNSATIIFIKDVAGKYLKINRWFEQLFHVSEEQVVGKTDFDLFPEATARKFRDNDLKVIETGRSLEVEEEAPQEDGPHTYLSVKFPLRKTDGTIYAITGIATDITGRKQEEESSRRLAAIVESSDDAIVGKDLDGTITSWNHGAERIFGYKAREIVGKPVSVLIPKDRENEEPGILQRLRRGERIDHYETIRRHKNGTLLDISLTISPVKDATGKIIGASKIARDITERKRIDRQQQALFELVAAINRAVALPEVYDTALDALLRSQDADRAAIMLFEADHKMRFTVWRGLSDEYRRAAEDFLPWDRNDPVPQPMCFDNAPEVPVDEPMRTAIERQGIRSLAFIPLMFEKRLQGQLVLCYNRPRQFTREELRPAQAIASQVTFAIERQRNGEALEQLVEERTSSLREAIAQMEEFSYSVSHDLRAPVRAMQGYARAVMEDYNDVIDARGREYLDRIVRSGARMDRLIQDILIYSRVARGDIDLQPVSLDRLVREIVQQYPQMQTPRADIMVAVPLLEVSGHEPSLTQALSNLLSNAVKFVSPGTTPKVRVWTERRGNQVRIWIKDNGIGIKPEFQHRLFGMFERMHPEKNFEGTGIGLAIVRKAVERMGGRVGVESDGLGGSRFWIQLPSAASA